MMLDGSQSPSAAYSLNSRDEAARREFWACLALRECPGLAMRRIALLLGHFGSAYEAVTHVASWPEAGVPERCGMEFKREAWRQKARLEWTATRNSPCGVLLWGDAEYPVWLRSIADPPPFLYFFGDVSLLKSLAVAVVGMRKCSGEGLNATIEIARGLTRAGVTIVSGMARGIDRAAHLAGLEGPGSSIGVLGSGIDVVYPQPNFDLYKLMLTRGLLVSEYHPSCHAEARNFPVRNRIISGLSRAVVVVEAAMRSGSLNTANHALEQNRELMAVPGPVTASSAKGCQELVRRGAKAVFSADDVLRELVPYLAEHVKQAFLERDLERFQMRGKTKKKPAADESVHTAALPAGILPWKVPARAAIPKPGSAREPGAGITETAMPDAPQTRPPSPAPGREEAGPPDSGLTGLESDVYTALLAGPAHIDDICRSLGQNAGIISGVAAILEVRGLVTRLPGMRYVLR